MNDSIASYLNYSVSKQMYKGCHQEKWSDFKKVNGAKIYTFLLDVYVGGRGEPAFTRYSYHRPSRTFKYAYLPTACVP